MNNENTNASTSQQCILISIVFIKIKFLSPGNKKNKKKKKKHKPTFM